MFIFILDNARRFVFLTLLLKFIIICTALCRRFDFMFHFTNFDEEIGIYDKAKVFGTNSNLSLNSPVINQMDVTGVGQFQVNDCHPQVIR